MTEVHSIPDAIQWHEGMLLAPQHFQQLTLRQESLLHYHARGVAPFYWGVRHLEFNLDYDLSEGGFLQVLALEAVMPDGLVVTYRQQDIVAQNAMTGDLKLDLKPYQEAMQTREGMSIHLAVAAGTASADTDGTIERYVSVEGALVSDMNTGQDALRVPRLRPQLKLLVTANAEDTPQKYVSFPLARLRFDNGAFEQLPFVPPMLTVPLNSVLGKLCHDLSVSIREKADYLMTRVEAPSVAMGAAWMLETKTAIHHLIAALPLFEAVLTTGVAHPYELYLALCTLVGHVASVGPSLVPPRLRTYQHNDLLTAFQEASTFIQRTLQEGIPTTYDSFPFDREASAFTLNVDPAWLGRPLFIGIRRHRDMSERDVVAWGETCLIGETSILPELQERRVIGLGREHRPDGADDILPRPEIALFELDRDPDLTFVKPNRKLAIFNPQDQDDQVRPAAIVLYVKRSPFGESTQG